MNILVTGAAGLVGRSMVQHLVQNHKVLAVVRNNGISFTHSNLESISMDLAGNHAVEELVEKVSIDIDLVIHCASRQPGKGLLYVDYHRGNVRTTENLMEWARKASVKIFLAFSTAAFYEFSVLDDVDVTENVSVNPANFYALSKWVSESYLKLLNDEEYPSIICLRIPSLVHEQQIGGIVHTYYRAACDNQNLEIWDKGQYRRSLMYISSLLEAVDRIIDHGQPLTSAFNVFNLGSADSWSMLEIARYIYEYLGCSADIIPVDHSSAIPGHWRLDVSKAVEGLGFRPWSTQDILNQYLENMKGA